MAYMAKVIGYNNVNVCSRDTRARNHHTWTEINGRVYDSYFGKRRGIKNITEYHIKNMIIKWFFVKESHEKNKKIRERINPLPFVIPEDIFLFSEVIS